MSVRIDTCDWFSNLHALLISAIFDWSWHWSMVNYRLWRWPMEVHIAFGRNSDAATGFQGAWERRNISRCICCVTPKNTYIVYYVCSFGQYRMRIPFEYRVSSVRYQILRDTTNYRRYSIPNIDIVLALYLSTLERYFSMLKLLICNNI